MVDDALFEQFAALKARVEQLERVVDALTHKNPGPAPSPEQDARLLSVLAACYGAAVFTVADLRRHPDPELHALVGDRSTRRLGAWLRRLRSTPGPFRLVAVHRDAGGRWWCLSPSAYTPAAPSGPRATVRA